MPYMPPTFRPGGLSQTDRDRLYDRDRGTSAERLYDAGWDRAAKAHLRNEPLCRYCELNGLVEAATLVDHFWPHAGDRVLFWQRNFWVSSCVSCHSGMKQSVERAGRNALLALAARLGLALP
jgi:5-methylcytosine-specific restriction protein A